MIRGEGFVMLPPADYREWWQAPICWLYYSWESRGFDLRGPLKGGVNIRTSPRLSS